jgi:hypothetical protein
VAAGAEALAAQLLLAAHIAPRSGVQHRSLDGVTAIFPVYAGVVAAGSFHYCTRAAARRPARQAETTYDNTGKAFDEAP